MEKKRILIIEDENAIAEILEFNLRKNSYEKLLSLQALALSKTDSKAVVLSRRVAASPSL